MLVPTSSLAVDQGTTKKPIVVNASIAGGADMGNVLVTYSDGSSKLWTQGGNCSQVRLSPSGIVGWTVNRGATTDNPNQRTVRLNDELILSPNGKVFQHIKSAHPIVGWDFTGGGIQLVLKTKGPKGPGILELHSSTTGNLIETVEGSRANLPPWAVPFRD